MDLEQFDEMVLLLSTADAFEIEDFAEVGVVAVGDVHEVGLDESLGRRWADLERFKKCFDLGEARVHPFEETSRGRAG